MTAPGLCGVDAPCCMHTGKDHVGRHILTSIGPLQLVQLYMPLVNRAERTSLLPLYLKECTSNFLEKSNLFMLTVFIQKPTNIYVIKLVALDSYIYLV